MLKLDYLLRDVVEQQRPLDWDGFWEKQATQVRRGFGLGGEAFKRDSLQLLRVDFQGWHLWPVCVGCSPPYSRFRLKRAMRCSDNAFE